MGAIVEIKNVSKKYGQKVIFDNLNLSIKEKDFCIIFGLPGSGKSVLMRLIMGLEEYDGKIFLRGEDAEFQNPGARNIGYIPQSFALFPHVSVYDNIAYPLKLEKKKKDEIDQEVHRVAKMLNIEDLLAKKPDQTSGGQKQRIAIARGIVKRTDLYIFDDPLVGLDFKLREQLVYDLKDLQEELDATFIYTTSDSSETLQLAKNIAVLHEGKIIEEGSPFEVYSNPQNADSMSLLGFPGSNMLTGKITNGTLKMNVFDVENIGYPDGEVIVGIRPESFRLGKISEDSLCFKAKVTLREDLGGEEILYFDINGETLIMMIWHHDEKSILEIGETIEISVAKKDIVCFDATTKNRL